MTRFETPRLIIRNMEDSDLETLHSIYTRKKNMQYISGGKYNWTQEDVAEKYRRINQDYKNGFGIFIVVLKSDGTLIGEAGLFNSFNDSRILELGYLLDAVHWNKGFGTEICKSLIDYSFSTLKIEKIVARLYAANQASAHVCEKCGMECTRTGETENGKVFRQYTLLSPLAKAARY